MFPKDLLDARGLVNFITGVIMPVINQSTQVINQSTLVINMLVETWLVISGALCYN